MIKNNAYVITTYKEQISPNIDDIKIIKEANRTTSTATVSCTYSLKQLLYSI